MKRKIKVHATFEYELEIDSDITDEQYEAEVSDDGYLLYDAISTIGSLIENHGDYFVTELKVVH